MPVWHGSTVGVVVPWGRGYGGRHITHARRLALQQVIQPRRAPNVAVPPGGDALQPAILQWTAPRWSNTRRAGQPARRDTFGAHAVVVVPAVRACGPAAAVTGDGQLAKGAVKLREALILEVGKLLCERTSRRGAEYQLARDCLDGSRIASATDDTRGPETNGAFFAKVNIIRLPDWLRHANHPHTPPLPSSWCSFREWQGIARFRAQNKLARVGEGYTRRRRRDTKRPPPFRQYAPSGTKTQEFTPIRQGNVNVCCQSEIGRASCRERV